MIEEQSFIHDYLIPLAKGTEGALGLSDDTALLPPRSTHQVITQDGMVANVHFSEKDTPYLLAKKLLRVNLSDIAAMGAKPTGYLLTLMLPTGVEEAWIKAFCQGLREEQETYNIGLLGGDTISHRGPLGFSVTMIGEVDKVVRRNAAQIGDHIIVTGMIGDAGYVFHTQDKEHLEENALTLPTPPVAFAVNLAEYVTSATDISDGLICDVEHICQASKKGATINLSQVPMSKAAVDWVGKDVNRLNQLLTFGDDYQLVMTVRDTDLAAIQQHARLHQVNIALIGTVTKDRAVHWYYENGKPATFTHKGYTHFL